jgi:hypothetical protein
MIYLATHFSSFFYTAGFVDSPVFGVVPYGCDPFLVRLHFALNSLGKQREQAARKPNPASISVKSATKSALKDTSASDKTTDMRRMKRICIPDATHALLIVSHLPYPNLLLILYVYTYSNPAAQSALTATFFFNGIFNLHSVLTGKRQMHTSLVMLNRLCIQNLSGLSWHVASGIILYQIARRDVQ